MNTNLILIAIFFYFILCNQKDENFTEKPKKKDIVSVKNKKIILDNFKAAMILKIKQNKLSVDLIDFVKKIDLDTTFLTINDFFNNAFKNTHHFHFHFHLLVIEDVVTKVTGISVSDNHKHIFNAIMSGINLGDYIDMLVSYAKIIEKENIKRKKREKERKKDKKYFLDMLKSYFKRKKKLGGNQESKKQIIMEKKQLILNDFIADLLLHPKFKDKSNIENLKNANLDTIFNDLYLDDDDYDDDEINKLDIMYIFLCKSIKKNIGGKIFGDIIHNNYDLAGLIMGLASISEVLDKLIFLKYDILNTWKKFLISYINSNCKSESKCKSDIELIKKIELNTEIFELVDTLPFLFDESILSKNPFFYLSVSVDLFVGVVSKFNNRGRNWVDFVNGGGKIYKYIDVLLGGGLNSDTTKYVCTGN
jgi:hypothetical protein